MNKAEKLAELLDEERASRQAMYGLCYPDLLEAASLLRHQAAQIKELREALKLIAGTDAVDAALDPQRAIRVACAALANTKEET